METTVKTRRKRGLSPRGNFEESKREAGAIIDARHDADRRKSEYLKALRLSRDGLPDKSPD
ncbi:hypothetical protein [Rhizobium herbae]|jgi:hypothetical protein